MSKQKREFIPKLRFSEFLGHKGWVVRSIHDICEKPFSGGTPSSTEKKYYGGDIPFIRSGEIDKEKTELFLSDDGLANSSAKLVNKGDILVALYGANSGEVALCKVEGAINQAILCLRSKTNNLFLYQYLVFRKNYITAKYLQGGQGNLSGDIIKSIELPFPESDEQKKIAECLASIDVIITLHTQKMNTLKAHKKGLMQQLFPVEGGTLPKLRFPEFRGKGDWRMTTLAPYLKLYSKKVEADTTLRVFSSTREGLKLQGDYYDGRNLINEGLYGVVPKGYFVYRHMSDDDVFKFNINNRNESIAVSKEYPVFKTINIDSEFLRYKLNYGHEFKKFAVAQKKGGTRTRLYFKTLCEFESLFPSLDEQKKIASLLSSIDYLIKIQIDSINELLVHKKGLMQKLFPVMDDVII